MILHISYIFMILKKGYLGFFFNLYSTFVWSQMLFMELIYDRTFVRLCSNCKRRALAEAGSFRMWEFVSRLSNLNLILSYQSINIPCIYWTCIPFVGNNVAILSQCKISSERISALAPGKRAACSHVLLVFAVFCDLITTLWFWACLCALLETWQWLVCPSCLVSLSCQHLLIVFCPSHLRCPTCRSWGVPHRCIYRVFNKASESFLLKSVQFHKQNIS